ncbi:MAG: hypothetical protein AAFN10_14825 [Bacteroidota bacterium]
MHPEIEEVFRHAARYSGRLSALIFMITFYVFASSYPKPIAENQALKSLLTTFAVLHVIHFGFLATNVFLNDIPIVPVKLTGGALAYLMIVAAPFRLHKLKLGFQLTYFYYVSLVMIITYVARIKGDFEGAEPFWFHYVAMGALILGCIGFGAMIYRSSRRLAA